MGKLLSSSSEKKAFIISSTDKDGLSWVTANFLLLEIAWVVVWYKRCLYRVGVSLNMFVIFYPEVLHVMKAAY